MAETICDVLANEVVCKMGFPAQINSDQVDSLNPKYFNNYAKCLRYGRQEPRPCALKAKVKRRG
jgi:hypothetical protein